MPDAKPKIWVWIAADAALLQTSELLIITEGADAVGTDLSITVDETVFVSANEMEGITATKKIHKKYFKHFMLITFVSIYFLLTVTFYKFLS